MSVIQMSLRDFPLGIGGQHPPGDRDAHPAVHHRRRQDDEPVAQVGGVEGDGDTLVGPPAGDPADQRAASGVRIEGGAVAAGLAFARLIQLAEPLADGVHLPAEEGGRVEGEGKTPACCMLTP